MIVRHVDCRGWTIEQHVADYDASIKRRYENNLLDFEDMLKRWGATPAELEEGLKFAAQMHDEHRAKAVAEFHAWLLRGGEDLQ